MKSRSNIRYEYIKDGTHSKYRLIISKQDGTTPIVREVCFPTYFVKKDGFEFIVLMDDMGKPVHEVFAYLNKKLEGSSYNTRLKAAKALRLLYIWLSLTNYDLKQLTDRQCSELVQFFQGTSINTSTDGNKIVRSNRTVNLYLSSCRSFLSFLGVEDSKLFTLKPNSNPYGYGDSKNSTYLHSLKTTSSNDPRHIPKYISPSEFSKIYEVIKEAKDETGLLIVHLMYIYGLRIGECLGLTTEDITEVQRDKKTVPVLFIRNRISDKRFQAAKNKLVPVSVNDYKKRDYRISRDEIQITYDFYEQLIDYINEVHGDLMENDPEKYDLSKADIVSQRNKPEENHYLFLNYRGGVLTDQAWNLRLRNYFKQAGIYVDSDTRDLNLNHRFRHGFAMYHAQFKENPVDALRLSKLLRHNSLISCQTYYNPTPEDEAKLKEENLESFYKEFPFLKRE